jgi:hypothetical protein
VQAVGAGGEEFEKVEIAEDLELLADFVGDMGLAGREKVKNPGDGGIIKVNLPPSFL